MLKAGAGFSFVEVYSLMIRLEEMAGYNEGVHREAAKALRRLLPDYYDEACFKSQIRQQDQINDKEG